MIPRITRPFSCKRRVPEAALMAVLGIFISLVTTSRAHANRVYLEFGAGASTLLAGQSLFGDTAPDRTGFGAALNGGVFVNLAPSKAEAQFRLGVTQRYSSGSGDTNYFTLMASYFAIRLEAQRVFLTIGAAPLIWTRVGATSGFDSLERMAFGNYAGMGEIGYHYPITPEVSATFAASGQTVWINGGLSPRPSIDIMASLRFFILAPKRFDEDESTLPGNRGDYEGYRYPYGWEKQY